MEKRDTRKGYTLSLTRNKELIYGSWFLFPVPIDYRSFGSIIIFSEDANMHIQLRKEEARILAHHTEGSPNSTVEDQEGGIVLLDE